MKLNATQFNHRTKHTLRVRDQSVRAMAPGACTHVQRLLLSGRNHALDKCKERTSKPGMGVPLFIVHVRGTLLPCSAGASGSMVASRFAL